jgi:hypothetical protein
MDSSKSTTRVPTPRASGWLYAAIAVLAACTPAAGLALGACMLAVGGDIDRVEPSATRASTWTSALVLLEPSTSLPGASLERLNIYGRAITAGALSGR